jgi:hypothetical protein
LPVGEVIFGAIGEMIAYIVFELILEGIGRLFRGIYYGIRKLLTGKEREIPELKRIEKRFLYKTVRLRSDFNERISKGTLGTVIEVIDEHHVFAEFEDSHGKPIEIQGEQVFKIERSKLMLERKKRTHNKV